MVRWWRLAVLVLAGVLATVAGTVFAVVVNVATGSQAGWFPWYPAVEQYPLWWTAGTTAVAAVASALVWGAQRWYDRGLSALVPAVQRPEEWVVDRPGEVGQVVAALRRRGGGTVGITTAVHGAGGFGKTTVAKMVRADRRVLRRFGGRVYWVTLGRDAGRDGLAGLVNGLVGQVNPGRAVTFTDARQAGDHLAAILARGPRRLLVLDDVWSQEQLAVFPVAGRCSRLVTTRNPSLAAGAVVPVRVDQMSGRQARALLESGLPPLPAAVVQGLAEALGRWPLPLRLANAILVDQARLQADITKAAEELLARLRRGGALEVDQLTGVAARDLDVSDPDQRNKAVRSTIRASTSLLSGADYERFAELAVFVEDETVPVTLIKALWQTTGDLDQMTATALCARLADLALVTLAPSGDGGTLTMHDVILDFLRGELGEARLAGLHRILLDAVAAHLPRVDVANGVDGTVAAWWELPGQARYLQEHLVGHMLAAGRSAEAEDLAADLRWVGMRLQRSGPAAPYADLAMIGTQRTRRLARVLGQGAHLLAPTEPPYSLTDILHSRVSHDPEWAHQVRALASSRNLPALINKWPLPDLPDPALRRTLIGHTGWVHAVTVAPDGTWLASSGDDGSVRIWDPATGQQRAVLEGHRGGVSGMAVAPDGTWLASGGRRDKLVRIWDPATGQQRAVLKAHRSGVSGMAVAPDGTWVATSGGYRGLVRIWDPATGRQRAVLKGRYGGVPGMAVAPDGTWLATSGGEFGSVRIWDPATGRQRAVLKGHDGGVDVVAVAPDGTWLASGGRRDRSVEIWDPATWRQRAVLKGHYGGVSGMAIAQDGTCLATSSQDGSVRIWDPATGQQRAVLSGHRGGVDAVAIGPDGTWLASSGRDGLVRIWDPATGRQRAVLKGHDGGVDAVAVAPDGTWLASSGQDGSVRIWDPATEQQRAVVEGHRGGVNTVTFAPDGTWLIIGGRDGLVRIWDPATGQQRAVLECHRGGVSEMAVAPDGTWIATSGQDGLVQIWDPATGRQRAVLKGHCGGVSGMVVAPDGTWLATSGGEHGSVRIWDLATWRQRAVLKGNYGWAYAVAVAPDGTWLASSSKDDGLVRIWDPATGRQRAVLEGHRGGAPGMAVAPDGTWLATSGRDGLVRIWDPATGRQRAVLEGHRGGVSGMPVGPDGTWLATSSKDDGLVRIWDPATGRQRAVLEGHRGGVSGMAVGPDGTWLATSGRDGLVRIWDPVAGRAKAVMRVDCPLSTCTWDPSGQLLAAAGEDGLYLFTFNADISS